MTCSTNPPLLFHMTRFMVVTILAGCAGEVGPVPSDGRVPPDFAIEFMIRGNPDSRNPRTQWSRYVLEPNRGLRASFGRHAVVQTYPRFVRRLKHRELERIYRHVTRHQLLAEPTSPRSETLETSKPPTDVIYDVSIDSAERRHRYATTPEESPPTVSLLVLLMHLAGRGAPTDGSP